MLPHARIIPSIPSLLPITVSYIPFQSIESQIAIVARVVLLVYRDLVLGVNPVGIVWESTIPIMPIAWNPSNRVYNVQVISRYIPLYSLELYGVNPSNAIVSAIPQFAMVSASFLTSVDSATVI